NNRKRRCRLSTKPRTCGTSSERESNRADQIHAGRQAGSPILNHSVDRRPANDRSRPERRCPLSIPSEDPYRAWVYSLKGVVFDSAIVLSLPPSRWDALKQGLGVEFLNFQGWPLKMY